MLCNISHELLLQQVLQYFGGVAAKKLQDGTISEVRLRRPIKAKLCDFLCAWKNLYYSVQENDHVGSPRAGAVYAQRQKLIHEDVLVPVGLWVHLQPGGVEAVSPMLVGRYVERKGVIQVDAACRAPPRTGRQRLPRGVS